MRRGHLPSVSRSERRFPSSAKTASAAPKTSDKMQSSHSRMLNGPELLKTITEARLSSKRSAASRMPFTSVHFRRREFRLETGEVESDSGCSPDFCSPRRSVPRPGPRPVRARSTEAEDAGAGPPGTRVPFNSARNPFPKTSFLTHSSVRSD